jgi:hypothetical protein
MKKAVCLIFAMMLVANATPLLWRGAKCMPANSAIFMGGFTYFTTSRYYDWANEEWADLPDASQTDVIGMHFMLGYAPIANWEIMVHVPLMMKSRDTISAFGLQDAWIKTRYQFTGGKNKPFVTGLVAVRIPTSDDSLDIVLDDQTLDIAAGVLFQHSVSSFVFHLKAGYWYNMKNDAEYDIGDELEGIFKVDYVFSKQVTAFLNFNYLNTFQMKDTSGTAIDHTEKTRFYIIPGIVFKPVSGLSVRPKFIYPLEMIDKGGSDGAWKLGLDIWYVANFGK